MPHGGEAADDIRRDAAEAEEIADVVDDEDIARGFSVDAQAHQRAEDIAVGELFGEFLHGGADAHAADLAFVWVTDIILAAEDADAALGIFISAEKSGAHAKAHGEEGILLCHAEKVSFRPGIQFFGALSELRKAVFKWAKIFHICSYIRIPLQ